MWVNSGGHCPGREVSTDVAMFARSVVDGHRLLNDSVISSDLCNAALAKASVNRKIPAMEIDNTNKLP